MRINHNIPALQSSASLAKTGLKLNRSMLRLSSGVKINSASEDPAGLAIANKLRTQVRGLNTASQNTLDGISLIQTAEGALGEVHNMLQRVRELCVQVANDTQEGFENTATDDEKLSTDKGKIELEIRQLLKEITDTASKTEFNKIKLLNGQLQAIDTTSGTAATNPFYNAANPFASNGLILQVGPNKGMDIGFSIEKLTSKTLGLSDDADTPEALSLNLDFSDTTTSARGKNLALVDNAISQVSLVRAKLGAMQNRLEHTVLSLDNNAQNTEEARSRIEDTDMAKEMTNYSSMNVISQAAIAILAQANQRPQQILQLLR